MSQKNIQSSTKPDTVHLNSRTLDFAAPQRHAAKNIPTYNVQYREWEKYLQTYHLYQIHHTVDYSRTPPLYPGIPIDIKLWYVLCESTGQEIYFHPTGPIPLRNTRQTIGPKDEIHSTVSYTVRRSLNYSDFANSRIANVFFIHIESLSLWNTTKQSPDGGPHRQRECKSFVPAYSMIRPRCLWTDVARRFPSR